MIANAVKELQSAKNQITAQISGLEQEAKQIDSALAALSGLETVSATKAVVSKPAQQSTLSAATIAKMRLAAKARWVQRKVAQGQPAASPVVAKPAKKKFTMSAAHREAIIKAQKARWAKVKTVQATVTAPAKKTMSAAAKAKLSAFQKARWAQIHAAEAHPSAAQPATKRTISAAARAAMVAGGKARWAKIKAGKAPVVVAKPARKMSELGRLKIKLGSLNRYGKTAEAKKVQAQIAALEAKAAKE